MPNWTRAKRRPWEPEPTKAKCFSTGEHVALYHTQAWRKYSREFLRLNPLCQCDNCKKRDVPKPSNVTDHIVPVKDGGDFWDSNNHQAMNRECHNRKSARERK